MKNLCTCGKPAHPCYLFRCEDCWVEANISRPSVDGRARPKPRPQTAYNPFIRMFNPKPEDVRDHHAPGAKP